MNILPTLLFISDAGINNPALPGKIGLINTPSQAGSVLATYIAVLWQTLIILGGIAVLINLLMAGVNWVTGGGEKGKVEEAKTRITQSIIGFAVLAAVAAIAIFLSYPFGINLLKPTFPTLLNSGSSTKSGTNLDNFSFPEEGNSGSTNLKPGLKQ